MGASPDGQTVIIACSSARHVSVLRSIDGGATFRADADLDCWSAPDMGESPGAVYVGANGTSVIVGCSAGDARFGGSVVRSAAGEYWDATRDDDTANPFFGLRQVAFAGTTLVALGGAGNYRTNRARTSVDEGRTWVEAKGVPTDVDLSSLEAEGDAVVAIGYRAARWLGTSDASESPDGPETNVVLVSADAGGTWHERDVERGLPAPLEALSLAGLHGLALADGRFFETVDAALSWHELTDAPRLSVRARWLDRRHSRRATMVCGPEACRVGPTAAWIGWGIGDRRR